MRRTLARGLHWLADWIDGTAAARKIEASMHPQHEIPMSIHQTVDASVWAAEFCKVARCRRLDVDEGWMLGWFANAMMAAHDHAKREAARMALLTAPLKWQAGKAPPT